MHHAETLVHEHDFIVVEPNYRLGPSGFWYNPNAAEDEYETNWGLLDQRLALEWVRFLVRCQFLKCHQVSKYINDFNGDASRVTLSGFSAVRDYT